MVRRPGGLKNIPTRTSAGINQRRVPQFPPRGKIDLAPLALDVGRKRSAQIRPFVPTQSEPTQIFDDRVSKFCRAPIAIEIFDPEDQLSVALFSAFLRAPESTGVTEMKITCRGRCDAAAVGNFRFQIAYFRLA
jgi:hypothetical protein